MGRRNDHSREQLEQMIVESAEQIVRDTGLPGLSMRKVAKAIGYTVGTLYLIFRNQDDLLFKLNNRTLDLLHADLLLAVDTVAAPQARLEALASAYIRFAKTHEHRWLTVFEHRPEGDMPSGLSERIDRLFDMVVAYLREVIPDATEAELKCTATSLWSAVHGLCVLNQSGKLNTREVSEPDELARFMIRNMVRGLHRTKP